MALVAGWLVRALPAAWGLALAGAVLLAILAWAVRFLMEEAAGEVHLARAWLGVPTARAPAAYVRRLFDAYAKRYDQHLFAALDYRVPNLLRDLVGERPQGAAVTADLGCGTGALAPLFRPLAARLEGVDLSPAMLDRAAARGLYDELHAGELVAFLEARPAGYDLLLAADVLPYLGDPRPFLRAARAALRPGGRLAFSAEARPGPLFTLTRSGRFAHDGEALLACARAAGLVPVELRAAALRREGGQPAQGFLVLLERPMLER